MDVKVTVNRTEPKKLKYRKKRPKKARVKQQIKRATGATLEALFILIGIASFIYVSFFL